MMLVSIFWFSSHRWNSVGPGWTVLGRESLFVYVLHLVVLYGSVINPAFNLQAVLGGRVPLPAVTGIFLVFLISMIFCASGWSALKQYHPRWYRIVQILGGVLFLLVFLIRKF
jgi:threonine/homoserine/homoserine lactone efflux protein